ncbi:cytochrome c [Bacillus sp. ISL-47]|uniref:cytochrome c550 n=1 Tax=Bacillus sp. ISL-47 TaxID=2819130 RepID=UPI001BE55BFD|nr:cytochrome c [Bacillus sp. ISL-47]MBT2690446.1 cytochrome c [Bacillus sp. ISL-47]MBT2710153.1 cytochrome c [Pseudomonas sp. ISL-84]
MNRNPIIPFVLIMVFGVVAMFLVSFKGLGDMDELAKEQEGGGAETEETAAASPEEIYQKSCIGCHGDQYQGGVGPALTGVGDKLSQDEIADIVVNGKGSMPPGLVPQDKAAEMAEWLAGLK